MEFGPNVFMRVSYIGQLTYYKIIQSTTLSLPRDATQSAVMRLHVVCLSVRPSVCL